MSCMLCRSTSLSGALPSFDRRRGWPLQRISVTKCVETHRLAARTLAVHDEIRQYLQKTCNHACACCMWLTAQAKHADAPGELERKVSLDMKNAKG